MPWIEKETGESPWGNEEKDNPAKITKANRNEKETKNTLDYGLPRQYNFIYQVPPHAEQYQLPILYNVLRMEVCTELLPQEMFDRKQKIHSIHC